MGFWSTLGKIGLGVAGAVAAPFTGGASLAATIPGIIGGVGSALSAGAGAAAANRGEEADRRLVQDQLRVAQARDAAGNEIDLSRLQLDQQAADRTSQNNAYANALRSALALNTPDVNVDRSKFLGNVPTITFNGPRPSNLGTEGKDAAQIMNNLALRKLLSGEERRDTAGYQTPEMSDTPKASIWEKLAGVGGLAGTIVGDVLRRKPAGSPAALSRGDALPGDAYA